MANLDALQVTISIVSHGQGVLVSDLLEDLVDFPEVSSIILIQNISEDDISCPESIRGKVRTLRNRQPLGFAANHNQAFKLCESSLFAVLNPDIRLVDNPFPRLVQALLENGGGVIAPKVVNLSGQVEDSARYFPTPRRLLFKIFGLDDGRVILNGTGAQDVDWVAGMFLLFPARVFREIGGFDERYYLYYEDVDICSRLWIGGERVMLAPSVSVIHAAQRKSRRNLRYFMWHLCSMVRFLRIYAWRLPR